MSPQTELFLNTNASAIFGLIGALGGATLSFVASYLLKGREFNLELRSKIIDKQISAHETILRLAQDMRRMGSVGELDKNGEVLRGPCILLSQNDFEQWFTHFTTQQLAGTSWLSTKAKREVAYVQDYLVTLHVTLKDVPSEKYFDLGLLIYEDFIDLSSSLEKATFAFFEKGIHTAKLESLSEWHKYKRPVTESRLNNTDLIKHREIFKRSL